VVQLGRERRRATARVGHDDPSFERLWRLANENTSGR
jgi:hypothetical protein